MVTIQVCHLIEWPFSFHESFLRSLPTVPPMWEWSQEWDLLKGWRQVEGSVDLPEYSNCKSRQFSGEPQTQCRGGLLPHPLPLALAYWQKSNMGCSSHCSEEGRSQCTCKQIARAGKLCNMSSKLCMWWVYTWRDALGMLQWLILLKCAGRPRCTATLYSA